MILMIISFPSLQLIGQKIPICKKNRTADVINIDLYPAYQKRDNYPLSMVVKSLEYVPLETTDENILGDYLKRIYITSKEIFVFDFALGVYRFTRDGKFINKIGRIGRGPEECIKPIDMILDSINKFVVLLDHDKLVKYDYSGNFVKKYPLIFNSNDMMLYKDKVFLLNDMFYSYQKPGERFSIRFYSEEKQNIISKITCEKKDKIPFSICSPIMYNYNNQTYIKDYWSDTIYQVIDPFNLKAYAVIQTGRFKHRDIDDKSIITGEVNSGDTWIVDITYISETDRFIFLTTNKGMFIYDKIIGETYCSEFHKVDNKWYVFKNDLNSGPDLSSFIYNNSVNGITQVSYNIALDFFDKNSNKLKSGFDKSIQSLNPNDNQVLVFIKFKSN